MEISKEPQTFERFAMATLERAKSIFFGRGDEYGDTWKEPQFLTMKAVARELGCDIDEHVFRALATAALVDLKYIRMLGGWKEDNIIDGINYSAFLAEDMREIAANQHLTRYCVGLRFNKALTEVALILKNRPAWQAGRLNGIGGHIEPGESAIDAMVREFQEECDCETEPSDWHRFCRMVGTEPHKPGNFEVNHFVSVGDLKSCRTVTDEHVHIMPIHHVKQSQIRQFMIVDNLEWLIGLALDSINGSPRFTTCRYP